MFAILIPVLWALLFLAALSAERPLREAALAAFTLVTVFVVFTTEALSSAHAIGVAGATASWAGACMLAGALLRARVRAGWSRLRSLRPARWDAWDGITAAILGILALGTLAAAVLYPITNNDSLAYHMPRVLMWFQNHSVAFYPTADARQLFSSPLVEYFILTLKTLALGSDRLSNMVQWLSYPFSIAAVSLIAMRLGASRRGQQVAAIVAATIPMAILQASTTQTDLTCALWCLVAVYSVVGLSGSEVADRRSAWLWATWAGVAAGLAIQTKPTAYLVLAAFLVWLVASAIKRQSSRHGALLAGAALLCVLLLNSAWYVRNAVTLNGDFLALSPPDNEQILIKARDPGNILTTALKNSSMLFGTPFNRLNEPIAAAVRAVVSSYGGDLENPLNKLHPTGPYSIPAAWTNHDIAPAPFTVALLLLTGVVLVVHGRHGDRRLMAYGACSGVAFAVCAGLMSWNPWITRILLCPLLVLTPLVGVAWSRLKERFGRGVRVLAMSLIVLSICGGLAAMVFDTTNPLAPRVWLATSNWGSGFWNRTYDELRFKMNPDYEAPFEAIAAKTRDLGIERVAVYQRYKNFNIYSLFALLPDVRIGFVGHTQLPDRIPVVPFAPQVVIELVPDAQYQAALTDGWARGAALLPPQRIADGWILFCRVP